jgi:uncharacterized protein (TIGR03437 family)
VPISSRAAGALSLAVFCIPTFAQPRHEAAARASANLSEIARRQKSILAGDRQQREIFEPERAVRRRNSAKSNTGTRHETTGAGLLPAAGALPSFSGFQGLADNFTAIPPDTQGAVGPNHVVTILNTQFLIQSRTGVTQTNFPVALNDFWSPLGKFSDTFDPRIFYDPSVDRWIASSAVNGDSPDSALLVATTQSGDPSAKWNLYRINVGGTNQWGDFPVLGFNANWVVVSMNLFQIRGSGRYINTNLYVFSKADLYDSNGTGKHVTFSDDQGEFTPVRDYDNSQANALYMVQEFASDFASSPNTGEIRLSKLSGTVGNESFEGGNGGTAVINDPWADTGADGDFGQQPGTSVKIDTGDSRLVNCVLRNGTIWCSHTVFVPYGHPTRAAAQWFQLDPSRNPPAVVQRGRVDDPTNTYFYAYPSIAVNKNNDAVIAYTRFSAADYATAAFSYRTANDLPNAMQPEIVVKAGEASYIALGSRTGSNRWGDYSATVVDPANDLAFWTLQEYAATPPATRTGAFGTWWGQITAPSTSPICSFAATASKTNFDNAGGSGTVDVSTSSGCPWQAASNVAWITIRSGSPGAGNGTVQFTVAPTSGASDSRSGTLTVAGRTLAITQGASSNGSGTPLFTADAVVNGASMKSGAVSPGEVITVFGTNLGPATAQKPGVSPSGKVDTVAGGTRLFFDGIAAPMIYAGSGQVAGVAPYGLQGQSTTQLQVEYLGTRSAAVTIPVAAASPAIFTANQSGQGQGAVLNDDNSVNSVAMPTSAGTTIVIYATGGGPLSPAAADGVLAQPPLAKLAQPYSMRIGGLPAVVTYAGAAPGIIEGVLQINAIVPVGTAAGDTVPIDITIGGVTSSAGVTIAVR